MQRVRSVVRRRLPGANVRNKVPVAAGTVVTAVLTVLLVVLPEVVPTYPIKSAVYDLTGDWWWGNPFRQLRVLGGIGGGVVAGFLASDRFDRHTWSVSVVSGIYAGGLGVVLTYVLYLAGVLGYAVLDAGGVPPLGTVVSFLVVPLAFALPLLWIYLMGGALGGVIGNALRKLVGLVADVARR
jgi:hypothetical protein